jgi:hypothetical protein
MDGVRKLKQTGDKCFYRDKISFSPKRRKNNIIGIGRNKRKKIWSDHRTFPKLRSNSFYRTRGDKDEEEKLRKCLQSVEICGQVEGHHSNAFAILGTGCGGSGGIQTHELVDPEHHRYLWEYNTCIAQLAINGGAWADRAQGPAQCRNLSGADLNSKATRAFRPSDSWRHM